MRDSDTKPIREAQELEPLATPVARAAVDDEEAAGGLPSSWWLTGWAGVAQLPPLPPPERCDLCCQRVLGNFVVGVLVTMFVGLTTTITYAIAPNSAVSKLCRAAIYSEAVAAFTCLFTLQYGRCLFSVRRSPARCFPIPDEIISRLHDEAVDDEDGSARNITEALKYATMGLGNVRDPAGVRGVYCVRCFVWRSEDAHHCAECGRCTEDFDHHCGVLGCCVGGRGLIGNMWLFTSLISLAGIGFATAVGSAILVGRRSDATMAELLSDAGKYGGGVAVLALGGYQGFMWFFYHRHAHRRVNKRRA